MIKKKPFESARLQAERENDKREILTLSINREEKEMIEWSKRVLQQPKDGTALKQLAKIGFDVLLEPQILHITKAVADNVRRNKRTGWNEIE